MSRSDEEIFSKAVEITSLEEQNRYLTVNCVDDSQRSRIVQLLSSHRELTSGVGPFVLDRTAEISESLGEVLHADCGKNIGPYRVIQLLGEGGMGLVYEAEQLEPIRRRVAVKVLKPGMDTQKVLARFELERQALSGMDHPGITRILDAGSTDTGRPYFVMELVKGIAITDYCRDYRLSALDRIHLMIRVCKAIQHAHQRGIIHRDIKPSNVLVSQVDGQPQPKIIDFGIAKLVNESIGVRGHDTYYGELIGTPAYMSPEQANSNLEGVDIRSDVYSLGVLLYELMTGETPHSSSDAAIGLVNVRKLLNESKVELPSVRLKQKSQSNSNPAANAITDLAETGRILKGDVDCIIMRALARDPNDRFQSITELQQDLVRFVEGKPIESVPPSTLYNVRKLIGRHRTLATAIFLGSSLVLIVSAVAVWFGIVATDATRTAETRLGEVLAMQSELLAERDRALEAEKKTRLLAQTFLAPALIHKAMARFVREHWEAVVEVNQELSSLPPETRSDFASDPELMMTLYDSNLLIAHPRMLIQDDQRWLMKILSDISQKEDIDDFLQPLLAANSALVSEVASEAEPVLISGRTDAEVVALDSGAQSESVSVQAPTALSSPRFRFSVKATKDYLAILCEELRSVSGGLPIAAEFEDYLGLCHLDLGQPTKALQHFEEAIKIRNETNPNSLQIFQSRLFIADCQIQLGNKPLALSSSTTVQAELLRLESIQDQSSIAQLLTLAEALIAKSLTKETTSQ
jgi:serine/threonine protein kinase/tetratricopeptide (TPR) repeat protein